MRNFEKYEECEEVVLDNFPRHDSFARISYKYSRYRFSLTGDDTDEEIYRIIKDLPNSEKLQDKIWDSFYLSHSSANNSKQPPKQRRFKKQPAHLYFAENQLKSDEDEGGCWSDSSDLGESKILGSKFLPGKQKSMSAKCNASGDFIKDADYDSLDEFCDVTFRNLSAFERQNRKPLNSSEDVAKSPRKSRSPRKVITSMLPDEECKSPTKRKPITLKKTAECVNMENNVPYGETKKVVVITATPPVEYDMCTDRRLKMVLQKCNNALDDIRLLIDIGIPQPDGEEDFLRRKKRTVEFANRFSRIYLYQINRLINDIRKLCRPHTTQKALQQRSTVNNIPITQKFIQTLQLVQQSLQAYYNHLPSSIIVGAPEKLKELLNLCTSICQLSNVVTSSKYADGGKVADVEDNIFTSFNGRCKSLLERISECCFIDSGESVLKSDRSKLALLGYNVVKNKHIGVNSALKLNSKDSRFSMYGGAIGGRGICRKETYWRNAIATLGKKHFNISSRYKTAKFKHRPDMEKPQSGNMQNITNKSKFPVNLINSNNRLDRKQSSVNSAVSSDGKQEMCLGKRRPTHYSLNDDNIKTQVGNADFDDVGISVINVNDEDTMLTLGNKANRNPPLTPNSTPQTTPHNYSPSNNDLMTSSQCDIGPKPLYTPLLDIQPIVLIAPPTSMSNTATNIIATPRNKSTSQLQLTKADVHVVQSDSGLEETIQVQDVLTEDLQVLEHVINESNNNQDWGRLSADCDRVMQRLDDRNKGGNKVDKIGKSDDHDWEMLSMNGKKELAKKLMGLVKKTKEGAGKNRNNKIKVTSVTGEKNAKLICIRDDNSTHLDTTTSDIAEERTKNSSKKTTPQKLQFANSQTQTVASAQAQQRRTNDRSSQAPVNVKNQTASVADTNNKRKNVKISKLPKAKVRRRLQMLDKDASLNVIRYKLDFHRAKKENPLYKKTANGIQPWTLMEKISDGILDHLLLSVSREIQVDDILVKLYESEFYAC